MHKVYSASVNEIGYDPGNKRLLVRWQRGGRLSAYKDVPEDVAIETMNAHSIGQALRERVQSAYEHEYVPEEE